MVNTIVNPKIPFKFPIVAQLQPGRTLTIHAKPINGNEKRFSLEFLTESNTTIPFHFDSRMGFNGQNQLVLNSDIQGWGNEETYPNPFAIDESFQIDVTVQQGQYMIKVNGSEICGYKHRRSPDTIEALKISGDIAVDGIEFHGFKQEKHNLGAIIKTGGGGGAKKGYLNFMMPKVPFETKLQEGFSTGHHLTVIATPTNEQDTFVINLMKNNEHILHFNPRLTENKLILNSTTNGSWNAEERVHLHLERGKSFSLELSASKADTINFKINGEQLANYRAHTNLSEVNKLVIRGAISLQIVSDFF